MFACAPALLAQEFEGRERGTAFGIWGATIGAAVAVGPLVGGALTERLGWEWIFFVNVPIGAATAVTPPCGSTSHRPESTRAWTGPAWSPSAARCSASCFALIRGNDEGWGSTTIVGLLVASLVLMVGLHRGRAPRQDPMLDLSLFRKPAFTGASDRRLLDLGLDVLDVPLPHALHAERAGLLAARGRPALPAGVRGLVLRRAAGRAPHGRVPIRLLLCGGLLRVGIGLLLMGGLSPARSGRPSWPGFLIAGTGVGS